MTKLIKIDSLSVNHNNTPVGTISLTPDNKLCTFEYNPTWLKDGFSISPFELPLRQGIFIAKPTPFAGNFGIFEDSLPDGYGRYMLHKAMAREGIDDRNLSALDRLSLVGSAGMGALTYSPTTLIGSNHEIDDFDLLQTKALEVLKEKQDSDAGLLLYNSGNSGGARPKAVFSDTDGHWLIKFRHTYDPIDMGIEEFRYNTAARACGINVPDFKLTNGRYFTSRRFDITDNNCRLHTATAGALLGLSLAQPVLDYSNLLALTGFLTKSQAYVQEMFRRMIFNYLTDNKDDHCKNFSFTVTRGRSGNWQWHLAPAYDLTLCTEGYNGEHATSVNGTGHPTLTDFITVGTKFKIARQHCIDIIDEVKAACAGIIRYEIK